ncbi:MAG: hypothetical protein JXP73_15660, partial [Deltaproteobacteria bacterium]|nr:hypothetical protein [Deltaproteobacteria bacterium]
MSKVRASLVGLSIAFLLAACGSGQTGGTSPQAGSGGDTPASGGAAGNPSGGAAGSPSGGAAGNPSGGAAGNPSGGAAGNPSGGVAGNPSGGVAGNPSGGVAGNPSGGVAGRASGGAAGSASGGVAGSASGGAAGRASGGTTQSQGGNAGSAGGSQGRTGGVQGSGGSQTGGGSGGATQPGTGGSTVPSPEPQVVTSAQGAYWKESTWTEVTSGNADVTVNDGKTYQNWSGFGGTFNEAGWDAMSVLGAADRERAVKLLFHATEGANFAYGRVPIGASDYAMDRYTLNENAGDYAMDKFSVERDRQKLIPYIKAALAVKPDVHLWASPWTPPTWMKTGSYTADGMSGWDGGNMKDDAQVLKALAIYLAKFVEEYGKENIKIEAVHPQNEPGYATRYPSCLWTASLFNKFVGTYLGPTFAERNVTAQIYLGTMSNNDSGKDGTIVSTVLGDSTSMKYVKGAGLQWNMMPHVGTCANKGLQVVQSEHKCGNY